MSLRQQLLARSRVACCAYQQTQLATFGQTSATATATEAQQNPATPHEIRVSSATATATTAQHAPKRSATLGVNLGAESCASCASVAPDTDTRVLCIACRNLWPGDRCLQHRRADLMTRELAADFTRQRQHCRGFAPIARPPPTDPHPRPTQTEPDRAKTEQQTIQPILKVTTMIVTDSGGAAFTPCPAGSYLARCVSLIDLGTQQSTYEGEIKRARKVLVAWEILDDETRKDDGSPFVLSKRFTQSLHEKAALRKTLASWRGRDFTTVELKGFDLAGVLGKDAFLSVIHTDKDGKTFANIAAVMKPPKGMTRPDGTATEPLQQWDMAAPDWQVFAVLTPRLVEQIESSPEFKLLSVPKSIKLAAPGAPAAPAARAPAPAAAPGPVGSGFDDMEDDVPF